MYQIVSVECYSGTRYAERPVALTWNGKRLSIEAIERAWQTPDSQAFVVRVTGDLRFVLFYLPSKDQWTARPLEDSESILDV
jgi:hypothetical protein